MDQILKVTQIGLNLKITKDGPKLRTAESGQNDQNG